MRRVNLSFYLPKLMLYIKYDMPNKLKNVALSLILQANIFNFAVSCLVLCHVFHIFLVAFTLASLLESLPLITSFISLSAILETKY